MLREQKAARRVSPGPARSAFKYLKSRLQSRSQFCPPPGSGVGQSQGNNPGSVWGNNDSRDALNYNDARRERTLRGIADYLLTIGPSYAGATEWERLTAWAQSARPADAASIGVKGFGLAGFQYLRMLLGAQTTKPDIHIIRYVSEIVGRRLMDWDALLLLEKASAKAGLPLREVDGEIWQLAARPPELRGNPAGPG